MQLQNKQTKDTPTSLHEILNDTPNAQKKKKKS